MLVGLFEFGPHDQFTHDIINADIRIIQPLVQIPARISSPSDFRSSCMFPVLLPRAGLVMPFLLQDVLDSETTRAIQSATSLCALVISLNSSPSGPS